MAQLHASCPDASNSYDQGNLETLAMEIARADEVQVLVGNECAVGSGRNKNDKTVFQWTLFVDLRGLGPFVKEVVAELHPTFRNRIVKLKRSAPKGNVFVLPPHTGWGTFAVGVKLILANADVISTCHDLSFAATRTEAVKSVAIPSGFRAYLDDQYATVRARTATLDQEPPSSPGMTKDLGSTPASGGLTLATLSAPEQTAMREAFLQATSQSPFLAADHPSFMHGRLHASATRPTRRRADPLAAECVSYAAPQCVWHCPARPRDDHGDVPAWLTASEFTEVATSKGSLSAESTMDTKCRHLARLIVASRMTAIYSGAGISVAAGIGQAARGNFVARKSTNAMPTVTHFGLVRLAQAGLLHAWVQQNHDGLPQKAGFPQEDINEIHGSWYDPSNPVVKYSGSLKSANFADMQRITQAADLVIVMGTSLGGLNADQVATEAARRSREGRSLGMVIINLQQTEQDGKATLRIFGKTDEVLVRVLHHLGIDDVKPERLAQMQRAAVARLRPASFRMVVPYDQKGKRSSTVKTILDLSPGARVKLNTNHNVQGARQPKFMHFTHASGTVQSFDEKTCGIRLNIEGVGMHLGAWWLEAASRGGPAELPVLNVEPALVR